MWLDEIWEHAVLGMSDEIQSSALQVIYKRSVAVKAAMEANLNSSTPDVGNWGASLGYAHTYNGIAKAYHHYGEISDPSPLLVKIYDKKYLDVISGDDWIRNKKLFDLVYMDVLILNELLSEYATVDVSEFLEIEDFLKMNLRRAVFEKPVKEIQVQDTVEVLLAGRGLKKPSDYDRETGRVKVSGKENVPDFVLKASKTALEIKLLRDKKSKSEIIEQMKADIIGYRPDHKQILFVVYDLGGIQDEGEFVSGFTNNLGVRVAVVKH